MNLLFLWKWQMGVTGYVLSVIVGNLLTVVFLAVAVRLWRDVRLSLVNRKTGWSMLRFGLPLVPTTVCWLITDLSDRFMVTYFCGEGTTGIYAAAYKIPTIVTLLSGIFLQAWQFSAVITSSDEEESRRFYGQVFSAFLSVVMLGGAVLILASRWLTGLLLAESYFDARLYMPTLIAAAVLEALVSFLATVYMVKKRSVHSFFTATGGGLLNVLLNFLLIPSHGVLGGALGAAMATLAAYALVLILRLTDVPRLLPFAIPRGRLALSCALLFGEVVLMSMDASFGFLGALAAFVLLCVLHARPTYRGIRHLLSFRRRKEKI
jgi:O-antigen/teichoic acid export membrane protein